MEKKKILLLVLIALILEVIVFNITSYYALLGRNNIKVYDNLETTWYEDNFAVLRLDDINTKVYTVKLNLVEDEGYVVCEYKIYYTDDTSSEFRGLRSKMYIEGNEKSKYTPVYLSGESKGLLLFVDRDYYDRGEVQSVVINEKIPFEFNVYRFLVVIGILLLVYALRNCELFKEKYSPKSLKQEYVLIGVLVVFLFLLSLINVYSAEGGPNLFTTNEGLYNKEFVDALKDGKLYLLEDPTQKLIEMDNPYDALARGSIDRGIDYKWDTAYYKGHQYIYFGILPALILFLPFNLITGKYLKVSVAIFFASIIIFLLLKEILLKLFKRYIKDIPFKNVFYSLISLYSGSLILYINGCCRFYEIAIVFGLCFILLGIYFVLKSMEQDKYKYLNLFIGSLFLALSVACRPIDLLVSIIILPYIISLFISLVKNIKTNKLNMAKLIVSVAIPYLSVGICLMIYNYVRFENPIEFGASYQLTVNNMGALKSGPYSVIQGLVTNLFGIPRFIAEFPFVINNEELMSFYGYYYIEAMLGGLFIIAPICFYCFKIFKASKVTESKEFRVLMWMVLIVAILISAVSVIMAGSIERYLVDYAWLFIIDGILIFSVLYNSLKTDEAKQILQKILCAITIFSFIFSIQAGIVSEKNFFKYISTKEYYNMRYTICFWE